MDFDCTQCVVLLDCIWPGKKKHEAEYTMEPTHDVPFGWTDQGTDVTYIPQSMRYLGPVGGGIVGPSSSLTRACANPDIVELWSFYLTDKILEYIADETNQYGNGTWVGKISCKEWRQSAAGDGNDGDVTASTCSRKNH